MPDPLLYLKSIGVSAIVSAMVVLAMARWRRPIGAAQLNTACILGIFVGIGCGNFVISPRIVWPPENGLDRFLTIVIPTAIGIELIAGFPRIPSSVAWLIRLLLAVSVPRILLHGSIYLNGADRPLWQTYIAIFISAVTMISVWVLLFRLSHRSRTPIAIPLALALATQCAGLAVMMEGYIKGGAASFPLVATITATTIAIAFVSNSPVSAVIGIGVINLFGVVFIGYFFGRLSIGSAVAVLLAPLLCWVSELASLQNHKKWIVTSTQLLLVAIPLFVVLVLVKRDFDRKFGPLLGNVEPLEFWHSPSRTVSSSTWPHSLLTRPLDRD